MKLRQFKKGRQANRFPTGAQAPETVAHIDRPTLEKLGCKPIVGKELAVRRLDVLVSGAGIAGCTLAYWLARYGHSATVVERSGALRSSGSPVDVRGPAAQVAERMDIVPRLRDASTRIAGMTFFDQAGRQTARVDLEGLRRSIAPQDIELPRGDLSTILHEASRDSAEFIFGDSITSLAQDNGRGVDVAFERSRPRRFDLVIGADGLHSIVRRLAFGPESSFVRHAGLHVATLPVPRSIDTGRELIMLNAPGKSVTLHPSRENPLAALIFWSPEIRGFDNSDSEQHKRLVETMFANLGWKVPEILAAVHAASDLYFDSVSRVELTSWARGRVALVGDASACVSLFGDGSTLAIAGAYALATALAENPTDHAKAFQQYQAQHGKLVGTRQRNLRLVASLIVSRTQFGISLRNRVLLSMLSAYAVARRISRRLHFL
jgi:2-polyprenyl-6-methoxyphenol hydroxylase-like FAD-dependent oxidoreductase